MPGLGFVDQSPQTYQQIVDKYGNPGRRIRQVPYQPTPMRFTAMQGGMRDYGFGVDSSGRLRTKSKVSAPGYTNYIER